MNKQLIVDILEPGQTFVICEGGKGGKGNSFFKSSLNRAPTLHENGDFGEEKKVFLKLRFISDVGIIGFPNVGKSTLISQISEAKPKIANYEFTTLVPVLGIVNIKDEKLICADMPGLIEGASEGKGLGYEFLKHIERCQMFVHVLALDDDKIIEKYKIINSELKKYNFQLLDKPIILVCNKSDLANFKTNYEKIKKHIKDKNVFLISAKNKDGIKELLDEIYKEYKKIKSKNQVKLDKQNSKVKIIEIKQQKDFSKDLKINKLYDGVYEVQSEFMKY
jgi:GTP-binding protein